MPGLRYWARMWPRWVISLTFHSDELMQNVDICFGLGSKTQQPHDLCPSTLLCSDVQFISKKHMCGQSLGNLGWKPKDLTLDPGGTFCTNLGPFWHQNGSSPGGSLVVDIVPLISRHADLSIDWS